MTQKELLDSIKQDSGRNEEEIQEFCERCNLSLQEYRDLLDRALIARGRLQIDENGKRTVIKGTPLREIFKVFLDK